MNKKKKQTKTKTKKPVSKSKSKPAKKTKTSSQKPAKVAKPVKKIEQPAKVVSIKPAEKKEAKKSILFGEESGFRNDLGETEPALAVPADPFLIDDFDTSRKELEEGYLAEEEEEEESSEDDDLYSEDETASFESYDDEFSDLDDEDDEYGASDFVKAGSKKKKTYKDLDEE